jgi:hypothetical protein
MKFLRAYAAPKRRQGSCLRAGLSGLSRCAAADANTPSFNCSDTILASVELDREDLMSRLLSGTYDHKKEHTAEERKAEHDALIFKVAQYVCAVSPGQPMKVLAVGGSLETTSTSGEAGFQYQIKTDCGFGNLFIFPRFASIWMTGEAKPRYPLSMKMIEADLKAAHDHPDSKSYQLLFNRF